MWSSVTSTIFVIKVANTCAPCIALPTGSRRESSSCLAEAIHRKCGVRRHEYIGGSGSPGMLQARQP